MTLREQARAVWRAGVDAVDPFALVRDALADQPQVLRDAPRVLVVGGGKAGAAMAAGLEDALAEALPRVTGVVNVPAEAVRPLRAVRLHAARPAGTNHPTEEGVTGVAEMLRLFAAAGPDDVGVCLLSGGGSALLPAPAAGVTLADKQQVTRHLHACGATIGEMNCVRKHLSAVKGGRLAAAFRGRALLTLVLSDVVGDPLDVIASGPTAADPTTYADALAVLERYRLLDAVPGAARALLERGRRGEVHETLKAVPPGVTHRVLGNNARALAAAARRAEEFGYRVLNLGAFVEGETQAAAHLHAALVRSVRADGVPVALPACLLSGGETTVTLNERPGRGGRNQEFVLAVLHRLGEAGLAGAVVLGGGTDGEDGPTDAAGAVADADTCRRAAANRLAPADFLARHDAYTFFAATGDLLVTGLTGTNVMDLRVILLP